MKNITTLFLLFILLLSLAPCTDTKESHEVNESTAFQVVHSDDLPLESCTSICICTCCGQRTIALQQIKTEIKGLILTAENVLWIKPFLAEQLSQNIWQPPKVA